MIEIPQEVWDDLTYQIACQGDMECVDNYRAYRTSDRYGFAEYRAAYNRGCCGFFESSTKVNGEKWIIGCNYGH